MQNGNTAARPWMDCKQTHLKLADIRISGFRRAGCYRLKMTADGELLRRYTENQTVRK